MRDDWTGWAGRCCVAVVAAALLSGCAPGARGTPPGGAAGAEGGARSEDGAAAPTDAADAAAGGAAGVPISGAEAPGEARAEAPASGRTEAASAPGGGSGGESAGGGSRGIVYVESPVDFEASGLSFWDGRPSLGGIWAAHATAERPMKVRIRNMDNGASVDGALLKRDGKLAGPTILLSTEAAGALGMAPGVVAQIRLVGLQPVGGPADARQDASGAATSGWRAAAPESSERRSPDGALTGGAAAPETTRRARAKPTSSAPRPAAPAAPARPAAQPRPAAPAVEAKAAEPAAEAKAAEPAAPAKAAAPAEQPEAAPAEQPKAASAEQPEAAPAEQPKAAPAEQPEAARAEQPEAAEPAAAPAADDADAARAEPEEAPSAGYVQVASFTRAENANAAAQWFSALGLPTRVARARSGDRVWQRVLLGPFDTAQEAEAALAQAREVGFADAVRVAR